MPLNAKVSGLAFNEVICRFAPVRGATFLAGMYKDAHRYL